MDDHKRYPAASIPPRGGQFVAPSPERTCNADAGFFSDARFAEIEYEVGPVWPSPNPVPAPQAIIPRVEDPIRQTFYEMRRLAPRSPMREDNAKLLYRQGRFMEGFTDDYDGNAPFRMYYPAYQHMGYEQLRTYFTWRGAVRGGAYPPIPLSYVFLHIYELLANIGVTDPMDGLDRLMALWTAYRADEPAMDTYLPQWLRDYHVYYELPHSFTDFVDRYDLRAYYPELFLFSSDAAHSLLFWNRISNYDITRSKFYASGHETLMQGGFQAVLDGVGRLCAAQNIRPERLFFYEVERGLRWRPFPSALFYSPHRQPDRTVEMPGGSVYCCKDGNWTYNTFIQAAGSKELAGHLIKKTEACLRQAVRYKFKINPDRETASFPALEALGLSIAALDHAIERSVAAYHAEINRTVVAVDRLNLERIRMEALGTQEKLSVDEGETRPMPTPTMADRAPGAVSPSPTPATTPAAACEPMPDIEAPMVVPAPISVPEDGHPAEGWTTLKALLSDVETEALRRLVRGESDIKPFADERGVMLEVLMDGINDKAVDAVGDNLLELSDGMVIYEEYLASVAEMVG